MNDDGLDAIAVVVDIGLMYYALKDEKNNIVTGISLGIIIGFTGLIAFIQLIHAIFTGQAPMGLGFIPSCYLSAEVSYTAKTRSTR